MRRGKLSLQPANKLPLVAKLAFGVLFAVLGYTALHITFGEPLPPTEGLVVQYKPGVDSDSLEATYDDHDAVQTSEIAKLRADIVEVPKPEKQAMVDELRADPRVQSVEPDFKVHVEATPNDPLYTKQYAWPRLAVDKLWDTTTGSSSVIVAVIDSGARADHEDLAGRLVPGYDFVNNDSDTADDNGHGTAVSGVVAAVGNNGKGVAGGCWGCKIMPIKAVAADGSGLVSDFAKSITYAVDHGAKIINMSVSGPDLSSVEQTAVEYAESKGVTIVAAAGNQAGQTLRYPASYPTVISVASIAKDGTKLLDDSNYGSTVDVAAPGEAITTTDKTAANSYADWTGTSFASPAVAGTVGLLYSAYPTASVADMRSAVISTAKACCNNKFPGGQVDAIGALANLAAKYPVVTPPTPPSTPPPTPPSTTPKIGDLNNDNKVNLTDLSILLSNWGQASSVADINKNGKVDLTDLSLLLSNWSK